MGWGSGTNAEGREVGYTIAAICDAPDCDAQIDHGLGYCCGDMHDGGEWGCGGYFCGKHLFFGAGVGQLCGECSDYVGALHCACGDPLEEHRYKLGQCEEHDCDCTAFDLADEFTRRDVPLKAQQP